MWNRIFSALVPDSQASAPPLYATSPGPRLGRRHGLYRRQLLLLFLVLSGLITASCSSDSSQRYGNSPQEAFNREDPTGGPNRTGALSGEASLLEFSTVPIFDRQGWGQPVVAGTVLLPRDWRVDGGVYWETSTYCLSDMVNRRFVATSPDGRLAFEMLPTARWQWGQSRLIQSEIQMRGCRVAPPVDPSAALRDYLLPAFRPGAAIREMTASLQAASGMREEYYRIWGPLFEMQGSTVNTQALRATLEYTQNGQAIEEWLLFGLGEIITPSLAGPYYSYTIDFVYSFRAPRGQLAGSEELFSTMVSSIRQNPIWETALVQLITRLNSNISIQAGQRAAIWSQAMDQIGRTRLETWQQNQDSLSRVSASWSKALRGVDSYFDPITQQSVELPTGHQNAWSDGNGSYILSPDPSFDPNSALDRGNWQRMQLRQ